MGWGTNIGPTVGGIHISSVRFLFSTLSRFENLHTALNLGAFRFQLLDFPIESVPTGHELFKIGASAVVSPNPEKRKKQEANGKRCTAEQKDHG